MIQYIAWTDIIKEYFGSLSTVVSIELDDSYLYTLLSLIECVVTLDPCMHTYPQTRNNVYKHTSRVIFQKSMQ